MSSRRTARAALMAAAGVVSAGAITLMALPANAATPEVTFTGKCSTLASTSQPSDATITTQKASSSEPAKVLVKNDLGVAATPYVDGSAVKGATIGDGESATLWFADSGKLTLVPKCGLLGLSTDLLSKKHEAATVSVQQPEASKPGGGDPVGEQPGNPGSNPGSGSGSDSDGVAGNPDSGSRPDAPKDPVARGAKPPADMEGGRVGPDDGSNPDDDSAGAPAGSDSDNNSAAGRGKAGLVSTSHSGPGTTTLALIAVICLLGVAAAALRTIVVSRATRVSSI